VSSIFCYEGKISIKFLYEKNKEFFLHRCITVLNNNNFLIPHVALWSEKFKKPSWLILGKAYFEHTHGGSRLLVAYLRGDTYINAYILNHDYEENVDVDWKPYYPEVINNKIVWDDPFDNDFDIRARKTVKFKHGIEVETPHVSRVLYDKKPVKKFKGPTKEVTRSVLKLMDSWKE